MSHDGVNESLVDALREASSHCGGIVTDEQYTHLSLLDSRVIPRAKAVNLATSIKEDITAFDERKRAAEKNSSGPGNPTQVRPPPLFPQDQYIRQFITPGTAKRLFITGEGGMGKTEYSRLITLRMAEAFLRQDSPAPLLPYRIELKSLGKDDITRADGLRARLADTSTWQWLAPLAKNGRVAFILDGTDELSVVDPRTFNSALPEFVRRFATCAFVFAGRPGTLPDGIPGLNPQKHTHILQPMTDAQIRQFAQDVFEAADGRASIDSGDQGAAFVAELRSKQSTLYPVIRTPFMLGFAISHFAKNGSVPNNPAELVEFGLTEFFAVRRLKHLHLPEDTVCFEALSTIAAFMQVPPAGTAASTPQLTCSIALAKKWLARHCETLFLPSQFKLESEREKQAAEVISQIVPAAGVLFVHGTSLKFSNRVIAEYLAARWIADHGYPNWPYRNRAFEYVRSDDVKADRERGVIDFFGDFALSDTYEPLAQAVRFQLGKPIGKNATADERARHRANLDLLIRCARWLTDTAKPFDCSRVDSLDAKSTLVNRVSYFFQAISDELLDAQKAAVEAIVQSLLPPVSDWPFDETWTAWFQRLPPCVRAVYSEPLVRALEAATTDPIGNWVQICQLAKMITTGSGVSEPLQMKAGEALREALDAAAANSSGNWFQTIWFAKTIASGFACNQSLLKTALAALRSIMDAVDADPAKHSFQIGMLAETIVASFAGDEPLLARAGKALARALDAIVGEPMGAFQAIQYLTETIASSFSGDDQLRAKACEALGKAMDTAAADPAVNWKAVGYLAETITVSFSSDASLRTQTREALRGALDAPVADRVENWLKIGTVAKIIGARFADDPALRAHARELLSRSLGEVLPDLGTSEVIRELTGSVAAGFADDESLRTISRNLLRRGLDTMTAEAVLNMRAITEFALSQPQEVRWLGKVLSAKIHESGNRNVVFGLARAIAAGCSGELTVAAALIQIGCAIVLNREEWRSSVTLLGDEAKLREYFIDPWQLSSDATIMRMRYIYDTTHPDSPLAVIVAPREQIRRGLPAFLMSTRYFDEPDVSQLALKLKESARHRIGVFVQRQKAAACYLTALTVLSQVFEHPEIFPEISRPKSNTALFDIIANKFDDLPDAAMPSGRPYVKGNVPGAKTLAQIDNGLAYPNGDSPQALDVQFSARTQAALEKLFDNVGLVRKPARQGSKKERRSARPPSTQKAKDRDLPRGERGE